MTAVFSAIIAALGFASDRVSKDLIESKLDRDEYKLWGGKVTLKKAVNKGFAMNTLSSNRRMVVTVSSVVFLLIMSYYAIVLADSKFKPLRLGFSIMVAGAAGNVYDRLVKGYVVDFINVPILKKLIFNLADVYILTGSLIALAGELFVK